MAFLLSHLVLPQEAGTRVKTENKKIHTQAQTWAIWSNSYKHDTYHLSTDKEFSSDRNSMRQAAMRGSCYSQQPSLVRNMDGPATKVTRPQHT